MPFPKSSNREGIHGKRQKGGRHKRSKKAKSQETSTTLQDDIEAQLERQRQKRNSEQSATDDSSSSTTNQQATATGTAAPPLLAAFMGKYRYDRDKKAYFPMEDDPVKRSSTKETNNNNNNTAVDVPKTKEKQGARFSYHHYRHLMSKQAPYLLYATQTCSSVSDREKIRSTCAARHIMENLHVIPTVVAACSSAVNTNAPAAPGPWCTFLEPYNCEAPIIRNRQRTDVELSSHPHFWDLSCKTRLPPSATTFDVAPGFDERKMPAFITTIDGGVLLRSQEEQRVRVLGQHVNPAASSCLYISAADSVEQFCPDLDVVRFQAEKEFHNDNFLFGALSGSGSGSQQSLFHLFHKTQHSLTSLPYPTNDFSLKLVSNSDTGALVFAPRKTKRKSISPFSYCFENDTFVTYQCRDFPQSDALCVTHFADQSANTFLCGHRNGEVSVVDPRTKSVACRMGGDNTTAANDTNNNGIGFGSTTKILADSGDSTVLAKGSFGSCHLYDVRKSGGRGSLGSSGGASLLNAFSVPSDILHPTLSSCCSGMATDPQGLVFVSPFVNKQKNPCLGLWSIGTGDFIGFKLLSTSPASGGLPYCELCSTITDAYKMAPNNSDQVEEVNGSFGLWFKCGNVVPNSPPALGSLHHIIMPGNRSILDEYERKQYIVDC